MTSRLWGRYGLHRPTGLTVTQCAVGQRMSNYRCGDSLKLSWDEAMAYAAEVAEKQGALAMPEKDESPIFWRVLASTLPPIPSCSRIWRLRFGPRQRSSQDKFRCSIYTYQVGFLSAGERYTAAIFIVKRTSPQLGNDVGGRTICGSVVLTRARTLTPPAHPWERTGDTHGHQYDAPLNRLARLETNYLACVGERFWWVILK